VAESLAFVPILEQLLEDIVISRFRFHVRLMLRVANASEIVETSSYDVIRREIDGRIYSPERLGKKLRSADLVFFFVFCLLSVKIRRESLRYRGGGHGGVYRRTEGRLYGRVRDGAR